MVFARFLVDFGSILGGFQAVRASAQDLGGFWASAQGLYIAVSAAFPAWVGTYTTNNKSGLQSRKTAATGGHKNSPGGVPRSDRKRKAANGQTVNGFYIYFVFFRISDRITSGKTNTHKTANFLHLLKMPGYQINIFRCSCAVCSNTQRLRRLASLCGKR